MLCRRLKSETLKSKRTQAKKTFFIGVAFDRPRFKTSPEENNTSTMSQMTFVATNGKGKKTTFGTRQTKRSSSLIAVPEKGSLPVQKRAKVVVAENTDEIAEADAHCGVDNSHRLKTRVEHWNAEMLRTVCFGVDVDETTAWSLCETFAKHVVSGGGPIVNLKFQSHTDSPNRHPASAAATL